MHIAAEWVLMLHQFIVVRIRSDVTSLARLLVLLVAWDKLRRVPSDLLRCSLLPLGSLTRHATCCSYPLLHRLDFKNSIDSRWIERDALIALACGPVETLQMARVARVSMHWLLSDEFN